MDGCFTESSVLRLLDGRLTPVELQAAEQHLDGCADCRALVAATAAVMPTGGNRATEEAAPPGELPRRVGRYLVRDRVGSGGMGTVYAAFDPQLGRRVALKLLRPDIGHGNASRARLVREAQAMARLQHANVVTVHDLGVLGEQLYIAMELVDGETLGQWLRAQPRDWRDIVRVFIAAGRGLAAAHGAGIVHRDFKPENVLVARDGTVRVTDFGVARMTAVAAGEPDAARPPDDASDLETSLTVSGALLGTPVYMSPEQLMGDPVDARSDVFSFCASLYEAVYGQRPFTFANIAELRAAVCRGDVRTPPAGRAVPDGLWRIIQRGLAVDRDARHDSMAALLTLLEAQLERRPARRRQLGLTLAVVAMAVVGLGSLAVVALRPRTSGRDWVRPQWQRRAIAASVTGAGNDEALARVIDERLRVELALGGELRVVPAEAVAHVRQQLGGVELSALSRAGRAQLRDRLGCQLILAGKAHVRPDGLVLLTVEVRDAADGRPRAWVEDAAAPDALADLTAKVGARLRQQLALQPPSADEEARAHNAFSTSPELAQQYARGVDELRRFDVVHARKTLEAVVAADPQQPLAWAALAETWKELGYPQRQREAARQAFERAAVLPREQRLWVEGQARQAAKEYPEAVELYRTLASFFPDNLEYGLRLSEAQLDANRADDSNATLARLAQLPPPDGLDGRIDLARASARLRADDPKSAIELLAGAQKRAQADDQRQLLARIRLTQCNAFDEAVRSAEALVACNDAEQMFAAAGDGSGVARATLETAGLLIRAERASEAKTHAERALDAYRAIGSDAGVGRALLILGNSYKRAGKIKESLPLLRQSTALLRELNEPYLLTYAVQALAAAQTDGDELAGTAELYRESITLAHQVGLRSMEAVGLQNLANLLTREAKIEESLTAAEQSLAIYHELKDPPDIAYTYDAIGQNLMQLDRLADARKAYESALKAREAVGWAGGASRQNLADVATAAGQYDRAEALVERSVQEAHERHMGLQEAYGYAVLTNTLFEAGKIPEAVQAGEHAAELVKASGGDLASSGLNVILAEIHAAQGHVDDATRELRAEIAHNDKIGLDNEALWARLTLAQIEVAHKQPTARRTLADVSERAAQHHMKLVARQAAEQLRKLSAAP